MPCVYGYNFLEPHNLLTSHLMQAFVRKCILVWHASTSSHIVCGSGPWWHQKSWYSWHHYSLKKSRHCVPVCCITHKTATKPINWFMKHRWIEGNLQGFLNHQFLVEPSLYILIAIYPSHHRASCRAPYHLNCCGECNTIQTTLTNGMQTPNYLEFHVYVGYSGGELQTWIAMFPTISVRHQQQGNFGTKEKYPQSSLPFLVILPLAQCRHTYPSQSKILLLLLLLKSWCFPHWYCDIGYLHHNMLYYELRSRTWAYKINTGKKRWTFHSICNSSDKLVGRSELCQLPTNLI